MKNFDFSDVICIILARGGSKGLKKKNLRKLRGYPLISYPIMHAKKSGVIGTILVSTDDKDIAKIAKKYGAEVPFLRPKKLAKDLSTTEEGLKHALISYEKIKKKKFSIGVFITATDIFRKVNWITFAVKKLKSNQNLESVFSGYKTHKNFWEKNLDGNWQRLRGWMKNYSSRQIRRYIVREDTGLACASRAKLWRKGRRIGNKVFIMENSDSFTSIDIHDNEDLLLAEEAKKIRSKKNG